MTKASPIRLGFLPLTDAAALIVAKEHGFFKAEGLSVELVRLTSWATLRDQLAVGVLDGGHMLAPLALAMNAGLCGDAQPLISPIRLGFANAALALASSLSLPEAGEDWREALRRAAQTRSAAGGRLTLATVFPFSVHEYLTRRLLHAARLDPADDVRLSVAAPSRAAELLSSGAIDGFCAGEPWTSLAEASGTGRVIARVGEAAVELGDKVFVLGEGFAADDPDRTSALTRALAAASAVVGSPEARSGLAGLLADPSRLGAPQEVIARGLLLAAAKPLGDALDQKVEASLRPEGEEGARLSAEMRRWGQITAVDGEGGPARLYRGDLFDRAMASSRKEPVRGQDEALGEHTPD